MKCINNSKKLKCISVLFAGCISITACGKQSLEMAYNPNNPTSSYRIVNSSSFSVASSFASDLCVTTKDVIEDTNLNFEAVTSAGLFDLSKKNVIYAKNIHATLHPASLTKVMTAIVALKYGNPDDLLTASSNVQISEVGAQMCGLKEGDTLTLSQALHALLIYSANDAGVLIAEHIGGSVEGFSDLMNEEAKLIGATNSNFMNPHGLTQDNHYVTPYDIYLIFNEAIKYDMFNEIIHMSSYSTVYKDKNNNEKEMSFETTNQYLKGNYNSPDKITVIGGKTGTTNAAGNCLVLLSKDISGNPYISVMMSCRERAIMYESMTDLLDEIIF